MLGYSRRRPSPTGSGNWWSGTEKAIRTSWEASASRGRDGKAVDGSGAAKDREQMLDPELTLFELPSKGAGAIGPTVGR